MICLHSSFLLRICVSECTLILLMCTINNQESADKKFGNVPGYRQYKKVTRLSLFFIFGTFFCCFVLVKERVTIWTICFQSPHLASHCHIWKSASMVQGNFPFRVSSLQSQSSCWRFKLVKIHSLTAVVSLYFDLNSSMVSSNFLIFFFGKKFCKFHFKILKHFFSLSVQGVEQVVRREVMMSWRWSEFCAYISLTL